jgi:hypothetical protein
MSALSWISHVAQIGTPMPFSQTQQSPGEQPRRGVILLVEDNRGDQLLTQEALKKPALPSKCWSSARAIPAPLGPL